MYSLLDIYALRDNQIYFQSNTTNDDAVMLLLLHLSSVLVRFSWALGARCSQLSLREKKFTNFKEKRKEMNKSKNNLTTDSQLLVAQKRNGNECNIFWAFFRLIRWHRLHIENEQRVGSVFFFYSSFRWAFILPFAFTTAAPYAAILQIVFGATDSVRVLVFTTKVMI